MVLTTTSSVFLLCLVFFKFIFNVYLVLRERERERQSARRGGAEREGDTESKQAEPDAGLELTNHEIMT